jgi:hypothetical protein
MTSQSSLRLRQGTAVLDLSAGLYILGDDCVPPATVFEAQIAEGTASNRSGGSLVDERPINRAWTFTVVIASEDRGQVDQAISAIQVMLKRNGDPFRPLYVEWRPTAAVPVPLWGQFHAYRQYEVVRGDVAIVRTGNFQYHQLSSVTLTFIIKPYARGQEQLWATAGGSVFEDRRGSPTGRSYGLRIPPATVNMFTDPVFGAATFLSAWTVGSALVVEQVINREQTLLGVSGAFVTAKTSVSTNCRLTQAITTTLGEEYSVSFYCRKLDGSLPTYNDIKIHFDGADFNPTSFTAVGGGWYWASRGNMTCGTTGTTIVGCQVMKNATLQVEGFMCEHAVYCTPLAWGDLLGNSWAGAVHGSASTRAASHWGLKIDSLSLRAVQGTLRIIWKTDYANTYPDDLTLFDTGASGIEAWFESSNDTFCLTDGVNTIASAAQTFAAGTSMVLAFSWGPAGLQIRRDGVSIASGATFTVPTLGLYLYLGSTHSGTYQSGGLFTGGAAWAEQWTDAEALADYTALAAAVAAGERIEALPWLWTANGDGLVENGNDGSHHNYAVADGLPGTAPVTPEIVGTTSVVMSSFSRLYLSVLRAFHPINLATGLWTAGATQSVGTSPASLHTTALTLADAMELENREFQLISDIIDAGTLLTIRARMTVGGLDVHTDYLPIAASAYVGLFRTLPIHTHCADDLLIDHLNRRYTATFRLRGKRSSGGAANVTTGFVQAVCNPLLIVTTIGASSVIFVVTGRRAVENLTSHAVTPLSAQGDLLEFQPERLNYLVSIIEESTGGVNTAREITYAVRCAPKYELI